MQVRPESPHVHEHGGRSWHFCSARCRERFAADPDRFVSPPAAATEPAEEHPSAEYSCPMHPEVRQLGPGTCPKCGMALEPVMPSLDEVEDPELVDFRRRFWWTLPLSAAAFVIAMSGHWAGTWLGVARPWVEMTLATPVVLWAGWPFFQR